MTRAILTGSKPFLCVDELPDDDVEAKLRSDDEEYKGLNISN